MQRFMKYSRRKRSSSPRRGQMLLMFFFFLLAFLPLMALIVDLSLVRLARREMQTAVNAAALEGLRGKGLPERVAPGSDEPIRWYDKMRRRENSAKLWIPMREDRRERMENCPFADERFCFSLGFTTPLQQNLDNAANGDLVAGHYRYGPQEGEGDYDHREGRNRGHNNYPFDRRDFRPFKTDSAGTDLEDEDTESESVHFDEVKSESREAFLARRRRTHRDESVPEVSSQELPIPVFFGHFWPPIEGIRENGITIRAGAIAAARPAMIVGPPFDLPDPTSDLPYHIGIAPFAIEDFGDGSETLLDWSDFEESDFEKSVWYDLQESEPDEDTGQAIPVRRITVTGPMAFGSPVVVVDTEMRSGLVLSAEPPDTQLPDTKLRAYYLPIFRTFTRTDIPDEVLLVVGFGGILVSEVNGVIERVKRLRFVAPHNASAIARNDLSGELRAFLNKYEEFRERLPERQDTIIRELLQEVWRQTPIQDGLLAPALVRALD